MKRSKRIEALDARPVNLDGYINEWPEMGFIAMNSPYDPKPSVKVEDGRIVELDGKTRDEFDFIDQFIADYAINVDRAAASMGGSVPGDRTEDRGHPRIKKGDPGPRRRHHTGQDGGSPEPAQCRRADDGHAENARQKSPGQPGTYHEPEGRPGTDRRRRRRRRTEGFSEEETTMGVARYAPLSSMALLIGSQTGRPGVLTQCSAEEATELELGIRGLTTYAETLSVYGTEKVFIDGDDTPYSKAFLNSAYASRGLKVRFSSGSGPRP